MDHFDLPALPNYPPIEVPLLSPKQYKGEVFAYYPANEGWTLDDISGKGHCTKTLDQRAAFLQTWLFFGLLSTVFEPPFPFECPYSVADYVSLNASGSKIVTLSRLQENLQKRVFGNVADRRPLIPNLIAIAQQECKRQENISRATKDAHSWLSLVESRGPYDHALDLICLSVAALGEHLDRHFGHKRHPAWLGNPSRNFITVRMRRDGWCPSEISRLLDASSVELLYFISNLDRPGPSKSHNRCREQLSPIEDAVQHVITGSTNPMQVCIAYQMDRDSYKPKHVEGCTACTEMYADSMLLRRILSKDSYPLLQPVSATAQHQHFLSDRLPIVAAEPGLKYVAISHVWSDGLGNPHRNSLPQCQYTKLSSLVASQYPGEEVPFWIDTISCPVEPQDARRRAIMFMRRTYSEADQVIVLDSYLEPLDHRSLSKKELWLRVMQCGWTRRLWTLQEGVLARRLSFQFKYAAVDIGTLLEYAKSTNDLLWTWDWNKLRGAFVPTGVGSVEKRAIQIRYLSAALAYRSTSWLEDEALCLGTICGLDPSQVGEIYLQNGHSNRMLKFWSLQPVLSKELIFWSGPRVTEYPHRWAPASFLSQGGAIYMGNTSGNICEAHISNEGLRFQSSGMLLGTWRHKFEPKVFLSVHNHWYSLASLMEYLPPKQSASPLALIFEDSLSSFGQAPEHDLGVLVVQIYRTQHSTNFAAPTCIGRIQMVDHLQDWVAAFQEFQTRFYRRPQPYQHPLKLAPDMLAHFENGRMSIDLGQAHIMFEVEKFAETQNWCVG